MDAMSYVHQTQTALLADANIPKEQLEEMRKIALDIRQILLEGTKMRAP